MDDKKVKIGVDTDYESTFQRIKSDSSQMFREMIMDAQRYTSNSREIIRSLEEQIRAIERRNKIDKEFREARLSAAQQAGMAPEQVQAERRAIQTETREDRLQTALLRELIETVRNTSRDEIRENRTNVERRVDDFHSGKIDVQDPEEKLKLGLQAEELRGQAERTGRGGRMGFGYAQGVVGSSNAFEAGVGAAAMTGQNMAGMGGMIGGIGMFLALGALAGGKALQAARGYQEAMGEASGVMGGSMAGYEGFGNEFSTYGYTMDQAIRRRTQMARAIGRAGSSSQLTRESFLLERGAGIDAGIMTSLLQTMRGDTSGLGLLGNTSQLTGGLRSIGAMRGGDLSLLPEFMQTLIQVNQEQLKVLGSVDTGMNSKMITAIASLDDTFKNPQVLNQVLGQLRGGLTGGNAQVEALQFATLSRMKPGNSLFSLMKMRENPFGTENQNYLAEYLSSMEKMSGGEEQFFMNIMSAFGTSATMSERIGKGFREGKLQSVIADLNSNPKGGLVGIEGRAEGATSTILSETAKFTNVFQTTGNDLVKGLMEMKEGLSGIKETMVEVVKGSQEAADAMREQAENMKPVTGFFMRLLAGQAEMAPYRGFTH